MLVKCLEDCRSHLLHIIGSVIQVFSSDFVDWLYTKKFHYRQLGLSKEPVIFGYNSNVHTDKILDLFILLAKYHIFHDKTNNGNPLIQVFVRTVKQRFVVEKCNSVIKDNIVNFNKEWALYSHFFPRCILAICRFLRLMWLLSIRPLTSFFSFVLTFCLCICIY